MVCFDSESNNNATKHAIIDYTQNWINPDKYSRKNIVTTIVTITTNKDNNTKISF